MNRESTGTAPGDEARSSAELQERLREFDKAVTNPDGSVMQVVEDFLHAGASRETHWEHLGVYGGAFGLAHHSRRKFILLQHPAIPVDPGISAIDIPYQSGSRINDGHPADEKYGSLIDYLFAGRRQGQELCSQVLNLYSPEFYWHFARFYQPQDDDGDRWQQLRQDLFYTLPFEEYLRNEKRPFLYCSIGEVAFFLYAWRLLFRQRQAAASEESTSEWEPLSLLEDRVHVMDIWDDRLWTNEPSSVPERVWIEALKRIERELASPPPGRPPEFERFAEQVLEQWRTFKGKLDTEPDLGHPWASDWCRLGLIDSSRSRLYDFAQPGPGLLPFLRFAWHVDQAVSGGRHLQHSDAVHTVAMSARAKQGVRWDIMAEVDAQIQMVVFDLLTAVTIGRTDRTFLSELHVSLARFPLLPLFYWTAADGQPKEHFVFPAWESNSFAVRVKIPANQPAISASDDRVESVSFPCPVVGVGLLGIRPTRAAYDVLPDPFGSNGAVDSDQSSPQETVLGDQFRHLSRIATHYSRFARPLMDSQFYAVLMRDAVQAEEKSHFAHRTLSIIGAVRDGLQQRGLLEKAGSSTRCALLVLQSTVSLYRQTPHDNYAMFDEEFSSASKNPLQTYIHMAAASGLLRAGRDKRNDRLRTFARHTRRTASKTQEDPAALLLREVQFPDVSEPEGARDTIRSESFAVMMVHSLGQALYHSLRVKMEGVLAFTAPCVEFVSKKYLLEVRIKNPGERPTQFVAGREHSKDVGELRALAKYFVTDGRAVGPRWDEGEGLWVTGFDIVIIEQKT